MPKKYFFRKFFLFLVATAICLFLIFIFSEKFSKSLRFFLFRLAYPFQKSFYLASRSLGNGVAFLGSISNLRNENEKLIRENYLLKSEIAELKGTDQENEMLRKQLELAPKQKFNLESSFVIGQDSQTSGSWLMIDKGARQGIRVGMPVVAFEGILVGRVEETLPESSKVTLLSNSSSAVNAYDIETGAKGVVKGQYGIGLNIERISQDEIINSGETIATSGLGNEVPKGLLIGYIQEVRQSADKLFQEASLVPQAQYAKLDLVFVIKSFKN